MLQNKLVLTPKINDTNVNNSMYSKVYEDSIIGASVEAHSRNRGASMTVRE